MKQQGLGLLYCLSVVYEPVFSFNYYTKLNSNRHLEGNRLTHMPPHTHCIFYTHISPITPELEHGATKTLQDFHLVLSRVSCVLPVVVTIFFLSCKCC